MDSTDAPEQLVAPPAAPADTLRVWAYRRGGGGLRERVPVEECSTLLTDPETLLWVDVVAPTGADLAHLQEEFDLHPLAIEDVLQSHQRPKVDNYEAFYFIVFYVADLAPLPQRIETHEVQLFVGERYLITIHQQPLREIEESARRLRQNAGELGAETGALLYALLDSMVDSYFPVLDAIGDQVEELQEAIFARPTTSTLQQLSRLRRNLLQARRVLAPEREVINTLLRREGPAISQATLVYFYDVYDHIVRLIDSIDTHREMLGTATDTYLSMTSNTLNQVMRVLTSWSIILMSASLIAGIYGMNFDPEASPLNMPELRWYLGYPIAILMMLLVSGGLLLFFRSRDWL